MATQSSKVRPKEGNIAIDYLGFVFAGSAALLLLSVEFDQLAVAPLLIVFSLGTAVFIASLGGFGNSLPARLRKRRSPSHRTFWAAILVACVTVLTAVVTTLAPRIPAVNEVILFANIAAMLCAFRLHPIVYVSLALAFGYHIGRQMGPEYGVGASVAAGLVMASCTYVIHLYLDHREDFRTFLTCLRNTSATAGLGRTFVVWMPAVLLVGLGVLINNHIQAELKRAFYDSGFLKLDPEDPRQAPTRDLGRDAPYTIKRREDRQRLAVVTC